MDFFMQVLGAYTLFAIISLAILFSIVGCALIAIAACQAFTWIRAHQRDIPGFSRLARTTSN